MATKPKSGTRNELIRCENCGEDYSVTYKHCPFCEESAAHSAGGRRGGKRLHNTRGGGYGGDGSPLLKITTVISIALIIAAVCIVVTIVKPLIDRGNEEPGTLVTSTPAVTSQPSAEPSAEPSPEASAEPSPETSSATQTAESFTLDISDITLSRAGETYRINATFLPSGSTGELTWTSSNPTSVSVAEDGTVTGLAKGNSTITATMTGGYTQKCVVRCGWSDNSTATVSDLSLNRTDITLSKAGETFTLIVSGTSSTPTWSSSDSSVASITSGGKVTALKHGTVTIKATVDGQTLQCVIRCIF